MSTNLTLRYFDDDATGRFDARSKLTVNGLQLSQDTLVDLGVIEYVWHENRYMFRDPVAIRFTKPLDWERSRPASLVFELDRKGGDNT
jgi:hypothetical protein